MAIVVDLTYRDIGQGTSFTNILLYGLIKSKMTPILTSNSVFESFKDTFDEDNLKNDEWKIYRNNEYVLLIPLSYENNLNGSDSGFNFQYFTEDKLLFNNYHKSILASINDKISLLSHKYLFPSLLYFQSNRLINFINLFLKSKNELNFEWNIYIAGHGMPFFATCGIYEDCFRDFLYILENKINTKVLYYNSCYSGGKMIDFIYQPNEKSKFSYPIFCQSLTDAPTAAFFLFNFEELIRNLMTLKIDDKNNIIDLISNIYDQYENIGLNPMNLVLLRMPNSSKFEILDIKNKIFVISDTKNENEYFVDHKYLIIDKSIIKNISVNENTKIISISKGDFYHYFEKIDIKFWYIDLFINFNCVDELYYKKIFLIKEIYGLDEENEEIKLENVIIFLNSYTPSSKNEQKEFEVFGIDDNRGFIVNIERYNSDCGYPKHNCCHFKKSMITDELKKEYLEIYDQIKSKIDKNEQPNKKIYEKDFRNFTIFVKQIEMILKPVLLSALIYEFLSIKKINESKFLNYLKNYLVLKLIYKLLNDYLINPKLSKIYEELEMPISNISL